MEITRVGVVGAGQMGNGIAHVLALAGVDVLLTDSSPEALARAPGVVARNLDRQLAKGAITAEAKAGALARLATTPTLADLGPATW
jgi:3-hydroxybutyryl-CoA dehydrogenase